MRARPPLGRHLSSPPHLSRVHPAPLRALADGISSAFPEEVQLQIVRSMAGLEEAVIARPGYDVEYDYVDPRALEHTLQVTASRNCLTQLPHVTASRNCLT